MASRGQYTGHEALDPFFEVIQEGLKGLVHGDHFYDTVAENAVFEFLYDLPGWPRIIRGRADLVDKFSRYGESIRLQRSGGLAVHRSQDPRVVILEYEVHGRTVAAGVPYDNRFISVVTIENKKILHWRDYMDSLAAWTALNRDRA
jgi:ketosteroid isomerase-like protein